MHTAITVDAHTHTYTVSVFSEALRSGCINNTAVSDVIFMNKTFLLLITMQVILQINSPPVKL